MARPSMLLAWIVLILASANSLAQTTAGTGTTIVFPVTAQTGSFASEVTIFNPGPSALTAHVTFFEANNSSTPGTKVCSDAAVPVNRSLQFSIGTQCPLAAGSHFGLLVVSDSASPQSNNFYGYTRVQNPAGIGFSIEGFPVQNFNNQVSHATGLKRQAASPTYQTNCFVGSLDQPVNYELKLFNDATGAQIGNTLTGSLNAFEQYRYLDVFGPNGVNAPAGDQFNVRAQFTQTSGGTANLIGFCTVQDNTSFGADFRIAKSYGSPSNSFFAQGGNTFGATAKLGTLDNQALEIYVNNQRAMRYEPNATSPNVIGGFVNNGVFAGVIGATIGGGGAPGASGTVLLGSLACLDVYGCQNSATDHFGTIGGGAGNFVGNNDGDFTNAAFGTVAGGVSNSALFAAAVGGGYHNHAWGPFVTVGGGTENTATSNYSTIGGGENNIASGSASTVAGGGSNTAGGPGSAVAGGFLNSAGGANSFAAGLRAHANANGCFVFSDDSSPTDPTSCNFANEFVVRALGGVYFFTGGTNDVNYTGVFVGPGSNAWAPYSDRNGKENFAAVDAVAVLDTLVAVPISTWNWKSEGAGVRHIGPMAQDFRAAFGFGPDDKHIVTVDADGVALAAIQGLHQLVQEKDARIAALERKTELQRRELTQLHEAVEALLAKMGGDATVAVAH